MAITERPPTHPAPVAASAPPGALAAVARAAGAARTGSAGPLARSGVESRMLTGDVVRAAVPLGVPAQIAARWDLASVFQVRTLHVLRAGSRVRGVAYTVHRPSTAYEKIAGWWLADPEAARELFAGLVEHARAGGAGVVKVEVDERSVADGRSLIEAALAAGFEPLQAPVSATPVPCGSDDVPVGLARWFDGQPAHRPAPYYRQTTELTAGAVALATALAVGGDASLLTRQAELDLYREVTTIAGSDPFGLAVAAAARGARPRVLISTPHPILLEGVTADWERAARADIQRRFRERALAEGLTVETRPFDISEVVIHVAEGGTALVLIDQHPLLAEPFPHWVTLHAVRGELAVVHDPWTDAHLGESWLDAADLPLSLDTLDQIAAWGDPFYRAALLF